MVTVDLTDRLVIEPGDGLVVAGADDVPAGADNLVARALRLVGRQALVTVHKAIPTGAGLGGGSADAAAILRWAGFDDVARAAQLGADVAFCLRGGRARVRGIGEILDPLEFEPRTFTLSTPPYGCATAEVYPGVGRDGRPRRAGRQRPGAGGAGRGAPPGRCPRRVGRDHRVAAAPGGQRLDLVRGGLPPGTGPASGADGPGSLSAGDRRLSGPWRAGKRVRLRILRCFFFRMRLRRFLMSEPMGAQPYPLSGYSTPPQSAAGHYTHHRPARGR